MTLERQINNIFMLHGNTQRGRMFQSPGCFKPDATANILFYMR